MEVGADVSGLLIESMNLKKKFESRYLDSYKNGGARHSVRAVRRRCTLARQVGGQRTARPAKKFRNELAADKICPILSSFIILPSAFESLITSTPTENTDSSCITAINPL
jgi:hypothetical protein